MTVVVSQSPLEDVKHRYAAGVIRNCVTEGVIDNQRSDNVNLVVLRNDGFCATIARHNIISIDNQPVSFAKPLPNIAIKVEGSKGDLYDVRRLNGIETCSCKAYQFRRTCRHLSILNEQ